ncbi:lipopolysaccharide kinase InaA family protein [Simiduia curdlanivorans]|uniref:Lipopolysaccharide kinase InaA family protein n=1 Tax=Simiduia curdlanivorans TaxID=1492769 RepID=A0ABV8V0F8_9GAMM|nr:lipopolysaccharide kinase InaA family protein [Simiduia curdlanivorans]MDN3637779.1 lipopolysaccharide kinase InaA family protein [Simiduia curdlanivorans]
MFHCADFLLPALKHQHLQDAARLWDWVARAVAFSPAQGLSERKTGFIEILDAQEKPMTFRVIISQNQLQRKGWLLQSEPKLRELYHNHLLCEARQVQATSAVCYAEEKIPASQCWRAVLLIQTQSEFIGAQELQKMWPEKSLVERQSLLQLLANHIVQLHNSRLSHHNLHPVNVLVDPVQLRAKFDHLEHLSFQWRAAIASVNDLACFMGGLKFLDVADTEYFLQQYWRECRLGLTYQGLRQRVLAQAH